RRRRLAIGRRPAGPIVSSAPAVVAAAPAAEHPSIHLAPALALLGREDLEDLGVRLVVERIRAGARALDDDLDAPGLIVAEPQPAPEEVHDRILARRPA